MSYILDALRKADAQRERDPARGIHAQSMPTGGIAARQVFNGPLMWGVIAVGVGAVALASWFLLRDAAPAPTPVAMATTPAPAVAAPMPGPAAPPIQQAPVVQPAPMAPIVGAPPAGRTIAPRDPTNTSLPTMRGAQAVPGMIPEVPPSARAADAREAAMTRAFGGGRPATQPLQPAPVVPAAGPGMTSPAATVATPPAIGLPSDAPHLAITGGVYSTNAAQRMLIVNGQVFNEGSELAPGLVLERVTPKGAVVKFRGANYTVAY